MGDLVGRTGGSRRKPTRMEAAPTRCRSALHSRTAAAAVSLDRRQPLQPLVLPVEVEIKIRTPKIRILKGVTREITRDKVTLTMAVTMAATETMMQITASHLNAKWNFVLGNRSIT
jgi:hypothetical protein